MFLYDKQDKLIDVFSLDRSSKRIRDYRIEQMKIIPANKRCLYTEETVQSFQDAPVLCKKDLDAGIISKSELIGTNKSLNYNTDSDDCADLLEWFYNDNCVNRSVARVNFLKKLRYLLIASNCINSREENGNVIMKIEDIIEIPKSLYLLQLLEQEKFSLLADEDITEQLELFNFRHINSVGIEELQKMDECGITQDAYSRVITKAENDSHVLRLLKK